MVGPERSVADPVPDGAVLDPDGFLVPGVHQDETAVRSVNDGSGRVVVVYQRFAPEPHFAGVDRSFVRVIRDW